MSEDSSTSDTETSVSSSRFDPMKALYSKRANVPVENAPMYENVHQYESALKKTSTIIPVGQGNLVKIREEEKARKKLEQEREIEERNKQRFAQYQGMVVARAPRKSNNVLTRMETAYGPLATLRECVDKRIRIKVITRNATGVRGELHANLVAFDKQWNLALTDVLEVWRRKAVKKRKVPPALGTPVPKGSAAKLSDVPVVTETPLGNGVWECTRYMSQILVRGEHVVLVNIVER